MANEVKLKLAIEGGKVVIEEIDGVSTRLNKLDDNARAAASGAGTLGTALGSLATLGTALAIIKMADSATTLHTALKLSTNSAYEATKAYSALYDIAQQSRVSFTELGQTYATVSRAGKDLGVSQDRMLTVTQAIGNAMTIGGGSAASMQAALVQLGQGLGSGVLRGEELNSVLEQTPRLAKALADGMGVPIGQLRSLGEQGKLTSEMVISALEKSAPQLAKELSGATVTVGQAFTMLTNSAIKFVGDADTASGASGNLASALQTASKAIDTVGSAIEANKASFGLLINSLAGAATVAGLAAVANGIRLVWAAVMAGGAANPVILGLMVLGGLSGAAVSLGQKFAESETIIKASVAGMKNEIAAIDALTQDSTQKLSDDDKIRNALRRASLESDIKTSTQKLALMAGDDKANESFSKLESNRLAAGLADQRITGAIALDEARKLGKLRSDIEQKSTEDAVKIVMTFRQKIKDNPEDLASLSSEMAQRLKANVNETLADLKSFDEKLAAPGKEAAKQRLADTIANYETYQGIVSTGEKSALAAIKAQKDAGYLSDKDYAAKERDIAANAATDLQALTELELDAVRKSGLSKKDRVDTERKYAQELASLNEQQLAITEKYNNAILLADAKLAQEKRAYRKAEADSLEKYFEDQAVKYHAEIKAVDDKITAAKDETAAILLSAASNITLAQAIDQVALARMLEHQAGFVQGSDGWAAEQVKIDKARELIGVLKDKTVAQTWVNTSQTIRDSLVDAFDTAILTGKDLFTSLRDAVVKLFDGLVLRPILQGVMQPIATAVTGSLIGTAANAATGVSATSGLLGAGGAAGIGTQLGSGMAMTMQNGFISGFGANMEAMSLAVEGGMYNTAMGMALPYVGAAIAGLAVLKNLGVFGSNFVSATDSGRARVDYAADGTGGAAYSTTGSAAQIATMTASTNALARSYFDTAKSLGIAAIRGAFEIGSNTGQEGNSPNTVIGANFGNASYSSGEISSGDSAALSLAASRAVLTALQASELPGYLSNVFDGLTASTATQDQITAALTYAQSLKTVRDQLLETREPLQILQDTVASGFESLGTSAASFKADFVDALNAGLTPEALAKWQSLDTSMTSLTTSVAAAGQAAAAAAKDMSTAWASIMTARGESADTVTRFTAQSAVIAAFEAYKATDKYGIANAQQFETISQADFANYTREQQGLIATIVQNLAAISRIDNQTVAQSGYAEVVTNTQASIAELSSSLSAAQTAVNSALKSIADQVTAFASAAKTAAATVKTAQDAISQGYFSAQDAMVAAQTKVNDLLNASADNLRKFGDTIDSFLATIDPSTSSTASLTSLKSQFSATSVLAAGGDEKSQTKLLEQAQMVLKVAEANSTSAADYARTEAFVRSTLTNVRDTIYESVALAPSVRQDILNAVTAKANADGSSVATASYQVAQAQGYSGKDLDRAMGWVTGTADKWAVDNNLAVLAGITDLQKAQKDLAAKTLTVVEFAAAAAATGTNTQRTTTLSPQSLLDQFASAQAANTSAQAAYATAVSITQHLALTQTGSIDGLVSSIASLGYANVALSEAQAALTINLSGTSAAATGTSGAFKLTADGATLLATMLGLTGTAAQSLINQLTTPSTAVETLSSALSTLSGTDLAAFSSALSTSAIDAFTGALTTSQISAFTSALTPAQINSFTSALTTSQISAFTGAMGGIDLSALGAANTAGAGLAISLNSASTAGSTLTGALTSNSAAASILLNALGSVGTSGTSLGNSLAATGSSAGTLTTTLSTSALSATSLTTALTNAGLTGTSLATALGLTGTAASSFAENLSTSGISATSLATLLGQAGTAASNFADLVGNLHITLPAPTPAPTVATGYTGLDGSAISYAGAADAIRVSAESGYSPAQILSGAMRYLSPADALDALHRSGVPGFAVGTSYVPYDMTARIHAGEEITPRPYVDAQRSSRDETNALLQRLIDSNAQLRAEVIGLRTSSAATEKHAESTANTLRVVTREGRAIQTEPFK